MFSESLKIDIALTIDGKQVSIPCGNVKSFELDLYSYGFNARTQFGERLDKDEDELFSDFITHDLIKVEFSVIRVINLKEQTPEPISVLGYVTQKSVRETVFELVEGEPVLERHYEICFSDIPQVLWRQHHPVKLYTEKTISDVLQDQTPENFVLEIEQPVLDKTPGLFFLSLENKSSSASFYDFVMWLSSSTNTFPIYDYELAKFKLLASKPETEAKTVFVQDDVEGIVTQFPESIRYNSRIHNVHSEAFKTIDVTQEQAVTGIVQDVVMRTPTEADLTKRETLVTAKLVHHEEKMEVNMKNFPSKNSSVGTLVTFDDYWGDKYFFYGKQYRINQIHLSGAAEKPELSANYNAPDAGFDMQMNYKLELQSCPQIHLPEFKAPHYPVMVEGKVVSEQGEQTDKTYQIYEVEETSQKAYTVYVPLWELNIKAPFIPNIFTGHFFFPAFRDARVLLAIYLDHAHISRFLDWGAGTELPMDSQGNHILFGKNKDSQTSLQHVYTSENKPELSIKRYSQTDRETIIMTEEAIIIETRDAEE